MPDLDPWSETLTMFEQDGLITPKATYISTGAHMTKDFSTDHGADPVITSDAFLLTVGSNKYWSVPAAYTEPAP